ncbi:MAG: hypothetical protein K6T83_03740 [Alicyclobacillus sp.]|nr:hypothetical protein [Alicyclobacillus sp.]
MKSVAEILAEREAKAKQGNWIPACGGTEVPFKNRQGVTVLYVWQPSTGRHAYLNCETDILYKDIDLTEVMD